MGIVLIFFFVIAEKTKMGGALEKINKRQLQKPRTKFNEDRMKTMVFVNVHLSLIRIGTLKELKAIVKYTRE